MLLRAILFLSALVCPSISWGAAVCGDAVEFNSAAPGDPSANNYTRPAGSNQVGFVGITYRRTVANNITAVTWDGNAMTAAAAEAYSSPMGAQWYSLANPPSGTTSISINWVGAPLAYGAVFLVCSGVNTAAPIRATATATGIGTAVSVTVAGALSGDVVLDIMGSDVATTDPTQGANQTILHAGNDGWEMAWGASQQAGADGGVMSWTTTLSEDWASMGIAVAPASGRRTIAPLVSQ